MQRWPGGEERTSPGTEAAAPSTADTELSPNSRAVPACSAPGSPQPLPVPECLGSHSPRADSDESLSDSQRRRGHRTRAVH